MSNLPNTRPVKRWSLAHMAVGLIVVTLLALWLSPGRAFAADRDSCVAAHRHPHSAVARDCRAHGWVIRHRLVIGPSNYVRWTSFSPCQREDSPNCYWNAQRRGDGRGDSFVIKGNWDREYRVWIVRGFRFN